MPERHNDCQDFAKGPGAPVVGVSAPAVATDAAGNATACLGLAELWHDAITESVSPPGVGGTVEGFSEGSCTGTIVVSPIIKVNLYINGVLQEGTYCPAGTWSCWTNASYTYAPGLLNTIEVHTAAWFSIPTGATWNVIPPGCTQDQITPPRVVCIAIATLTI